MAEFDFSEAISQARAKYGSIAEALDMDRLKAQIAELEQQAAEPGLWDDPENAQKVTSRLSAAQSQLKRLNSASQRIDDVETLVELGQEEQDQEHGGGAAHRQRADDLLDGGIAKQRADHRTTATPMVIRNSTGSKYEPQEISRTIRMIPNAAR